MKQERANKEEAGRAYQAALRARKKAERAYMKAGRAMANRERAYMSAGLLYEAAKRDYEETVRACFEALQAREEA